MTVNMTAVGQKTTCSFVVLDANGNQIPMADLTLTAQVSDPSVISVSINSQLGNLTQITGLKAGSATITYQFALVPGTQYSGTFNAVGPDTINVALTPVNPAVSDSYSAPQ